MINQWHSTSKRCSSLISKDSPWGMRLKICLQSSARTTSHTMIALLTKACLRPPKEKPQENNLRNKKSPRSITSIHLYSLSKSVIFLLMMMFSTMCPSCTMEARFITSRESSSRNACKTPVPKNLQNLNFNSIASTLWLEQRTSSKMFP